MIVTTTSKLVFIYRELSTLHFYSMYIPIRNKSKFNFQICETRISNFTSVTSMEKFGHHQYVIYSDDKYPRRINLILKERKSSQPPKKPSVVLVISNKCCTRRPYPKRGSTLVRSPSRQGKPQGASPRSTRLKISA